MSGLKWATSALVVALMSTAGMSAASAAPHDLQLSRFLDFEVDENADDDGGRTWGYATGDDELFHQFAREFGQVMAPRPGAPAETLGQAGFGVKASTSLSAIPAGEEQWTTAAEGRNPAAALFTSQLQVRKGLPFSFELGGNLTHLGASQVFAMGADLRWALHEGYAYFPDIGARGSVNTVVGAPELNMVNAAWDISMSKSFGVGGVMSLTPYLGYQQLYTVASTRVLNAYPQDPRPPQTLSRDDDRDLNFAPEYVFGQETHQINRFFGGLRLNTWILSFTLEALIGEEVNQFSLNTGVEF